MPTSSPDGYTVAWKNRPQYAFHVSDTLVYTASTPIASRAETTGYPAFLVAEKAKADNILTVKLSISDASDNDYSQSFVLPLVMARNGESYNFPGTRLNDFR